MATKSANLYARIKPEVKEKQKVFCLHLVFLLSANMFYKHYLTERTSFEVKYHPLDLLI